MCFRYNFITSDQNISNVKKYKEKSIMNIKQII